MHHTKVQWVTCEGAARHHATERCGTYRLLLGAQEDTDGAGKAFHAQQVIPVGRNGNHVHHVLFLAAVGSELAQKKKEVAQR